MTCLTEAPKILLCCHHCGGEGEILETIQVYEAGCGFSHPDVHSKPCEACGGNPLLIADHPGEKIVTNYWRKPGPTNQFDWEAYFDNDEPNDAGSMMVGYGATESEAIDDLLRLAQEAEDCRA